MNLHPTLFEEYHYLRFSKKIGDKCDHYLLALGFYLQRTQSVLFSIESVDEFHHLCRAGDDVEPQALFDAFIEAGFIEETEDGLLKGLYFEDANRSLIARWNNGQKGGRPKVKKKRNKEKEVLTENKSSNNDEEDDIPW